MLGVLYSLRALDAIHLASAIVVRNFVFGEEMRFVCSDKELIEAAQKEGFTTWNPVTDAVLEVSDENHND